MRYVRFAGFIGLVISTVLIATFAQGESAREPVPAPKDQKFLSADDVLLVSWYESYCPSVRLKEKYKPGIDCEPIYTGFGEKAYAILELYNNDGSLWQEFDRHPSSAHRGSLKQDGFLPFANIPAEWGSPVMRVVAYSDHWFKVEVNETTRAIKFAPRFGEMWRTISWEYFIDGNYGSFKIDGKRTKLLDSIGGKPIPEFDHGEELELYTFRIDGDWIELQPKFDNPKEVKGWVRWRDGRKFLVGIGFIPFNGTN